MQTVEAEKANENVNSGAANLGTLTNGEYKGIADGTSLYLLPEEVEVEEIGDRIPGADDDDLTEQIAASIEAVGQQEPVKVSTKTGKPVLFMGRRRKNAIALINAGKKKGEEPLRLWAIVDNSKGDSFQRAIHENIHRKNYTAIELSNIVAKVRELNGWAGGKNTKHVADYLKVSPATVTTHEKLLTLPEDVRRRGQEERLSAGAMIDLADSVQPDKRQAVIEGAKAKAKAEAETAKTKKDQKQVKAGKEKEDAEAGDETGKIKRKHIVEAAREAEALTKPKSRSKSEIAEFFESIAGSPAYGHQNSPVRTFAAYFLDKFMAGVGSSKAALNRFDAMVMDSNTGQCYSGQGTPNKQELAEDEAKEAKAKEKAGKLKAKAKAAAKGK